MLSNVSRRKVLRETGGLGLLGIGLATSASAESHTQSRNQAHWPMVQYDAANSRFNATAAGPQQRPQSVWSTQLESAESPVVDETRLYLGGDALTALDLETGELVWRTDNEGDSYSTPAAANGLIYAGRSRSDETGLTGEVVGVNVESGKVVQSIPVTDVSSKASFSFSAPKVIEQDLYILGVRGDTPGLPMAFLYAVDLTTGSVRWCRSVGDVPSRLLTDEVYDGPAISGETIVVSTTDVTAFDTGDGSERWSTSLAAGTPSTQPALSGDTVFVGGDNDSFYSLSLTDGSIKWQSEETAESWSAPAVAEETVYVGSTGVLRLVLKFGEEEQTGQRGSLYAFNTDTGRVISEAEFFGELIANPYIPNPDFEPLVDISDRGTWGAPIVTDKRLYVPTLSEIFVAVGGEGDTESHLVAFDIQPNGSFNEPLWNPQVDEFGQLIATEETLYLEDSMLSAFQNG